MRLAKIKKTYLVAAAALAVGAMICLPRFASAAVTGVCSDCHTMHNSQNGSPMTFDGSNTPNDELVRGNCLVCHTATTANGGNTGSNETPYVYSTSEPTYGVGGTTLAGGNFWWCKNGSSSGTALAGGGHAVDYLYSNLTPSLAYAFTTPPGYTDTSGPAGTWVLSTNPLTCAGTYGCHGDRSATNNFSAVHGAHHANDATIDGSTVGTSFRFLNGILGTEENSASYKWEYQATSGHHNEYYGVGRTGNDVDTTGTISHLCAECHGAFHNDSGTYAGGPGILPSSVTTMASPWIRHPTDFNMDTEGSGTEYAGYTAYDPNVPLGRKVLQGITTDTDAYSSLATKGAIVMCISCHRAHGSPYADLLRWDYSTMVAGTTAPTSKGCFTCHTTKD